MKPIVLKQEFSGKVIAYGKSGNALGERDDLAELLILSYEAKRQDYIDMFEDPPSLEELKGEKVNEVLNELSAAIFSNKDENDGNKITTEFTEEI